MYYRFKYDSLLSYLLCFLLGFITAFFIFQSYVPVYSSKQYIRPMSINQLKKQSNGFKEKANVIYAVFSAPDNFERRMAIRETWQDFVNNEDRLYYIIGIQNLPKDDRESLIDEGREYEDLMLLDDIQDSYENLANKLLSLIKCLDKFFIFNYMVKLDDDSFVQTRKLKEYLTNLSYKEKLYLGFFDGRATPKKGGKWREERWFLCDHYLPYALGGGYVLSSDIVHFLHSISNNLTLYSSEDTSIGTWLSPFEIHRVHEPLFDTEYMSRGCNNNYLVTHKQTPILMKEKHANFIQTRKICKKEIKIRKSYHYNWNEQPSKCCYRNNSLVP